MTTTSFRWGPVAKWRRLVTSPSFFAIGFAAVVATALAVPAGTKSSQVTTVQVSGRGKPFFNFLVGAQAPVPFRGQDSGAAALQSGQAEPRALASADLDGNGTPDVVAGYALGTTGLVTIQRGNPDAYAPKD